MLIRGKKGFTLIELMIVVAIIGILAAIAIPQFLRFQAKSKQSEARTILSGIYTAETAYFAEQNTFRAAKSSPANTSSPEELAGSDFTHIGYVPASFPKYYKDFWASINTTGNKFSAYASGNIDTDATIDKWSIKDDQREPKNVRDDVAS